MEKQSHRYEAFPQELRELRQWIVWGRGRLRKNGKYEKVPYTPTTGQKADPTNPTTWGSYEEAYAAEGGYEGIGFMFSADDPYTGIDLDHCRDPETGRLEGWAMSHVVQQDSYTEISPSGTGVHIIVRAQKPGKRSRKGDVEMYDRDHFFTITGQHLADTPATIEDRAEEVSALYAFIFWRDEPDPNEQEEVGLPKNWSDEQLLAAAMRGKKGARFHRLWVGDASDYLTGDGTPDESAADLALCRYLAFWTGRNRERIDRLFRQSGLMRPKWERANYRERTMSSAIDSTKQTYTGTATPEQAVEVEDHDAPWLTSYETVDQRGKRLKDAAKTVEDEIRQARRERRSSISILNLPPGVGKTHVVASLGKRTQNHPLGKLNIGLIVERKDQLKQSMFRDWHKQDGCTPQNCPDYEKHQALAERGYNTAVIHKAHNCLYWQQMEREGSTGYQVEHVGTSYIREHDIIVIDEFNVSKWIPARYFRVSDLHAAAAKYGLHEGGNLLLGAFASVVGGVSEPLQGKALFDAVNMRCGGRLAEIVEALYADEEEMQARPWAEENLLAEIAKLPPIIVPLLVHRLHAELAKWQTGKDWNSHIRIAQQTKEDGESNPEWTLCISERRRFRRPPDALIIMDATADRRIQELFWGKPVKMVRAQLEPAARTQHIAVRSGKGYRKTGLTTAKYAEKDRGRVERELRYILQNHCPNGEIGLITFKKSMLDYLGDALDIPAEVGGKKRRRNFWGQRGTNDLTDVDVLVVVGTPVWNPQDIARMGRVLWSEDDRPIDERFVDGRFVDERLQHLSDHITHSELTQAAHRNRALRHPNKTVVTLCVGEIDYLPPTRTVKRMGKLTKMGETREQAAVARDERIAAAYEQMICEGVLVNGRTLARRAGVRKETAYAWLKKNGPEMEEEEAA